MGLRGFLQRGIDGVFTRVEEGVDEKDSLRRAPFPILSTSELVQRLRGRSASKRSR